MSPNDTGLLYPLLLGSPIAAQTSTGEPSGSQPTAAVALVVTADRRLAADVTATFGAKYVVHALEASDRALELAEVLRPELLLIDASDAPSNALALCRDLRACAATTGTPLLVLAPRSARQSTHDTGAAFAAGADDCVETPFHPAELLARADVHVRLRRLTQQLFHQERLATLGSLVASVAHDVRNPLSAMMSGLPALRRRLQPPPDGASAELLDVMFDCAERIERTTRDLLDLSRVDRGANSAFAPGRGLLACTRMFNTRFMDGSVALDADIDTEATTCGRAGEVTHAFLNIIDNALRALAGPGRVEVRGHVCGDHYVVTIGDSGPGIDPAALTRVFEPYWTTRPAGEGTGLGLSIARQIVEEHGGTIAAGRSSLGGAEFTIRLPMRQADRAVA